MYAFRLTHKEDCIHFVKKESFVIFLSLSACFPSHKLKKGSALSERDANYCNLE